MDGSIFEEDAVDFCRQMNEGKWSSEKCEGVDPITLEPIAPELLIRLRVKTPRGYALQCYDVIQLKKLIIVAEAERRVPTFPDSRIPLTPAQIQRIKRHAASVPAEFEAERKRGAEQRLAVQQRQLADIEAAFQEEDQKRNIDRGAVRGAIADALVQVLAQSFREEVKGMLYNAIDNSKMPEREKQGARNAATIFVESKAFSSEIRDIIEDDRRSLPGLITRIEAQELKTGQNTADIVNKYTHLDDIQYVQLQNLAQNAVGGIAELAASRGSDSAELLGLITENADFQAADNIVRPYIPLFQDAFGYE